MKNSALWEQYQYYTRGLTEHSRQLAFAGAAICWFFKDDQFSFPALIYLALFAFVVFFAFDVLHYLAGAITIFWFTRYHENKLWRDTGNIEGEIGKPVWVDVPAQVFFALKLLALLAGFAFLCAEFCERL